MTLPPWLLLALVLALAIAFAYQLATRRYGWRVLFYWALVLLGLLGGEAAAESLGWNVTRFGDLRVVPDLVAAGLIVAILWFLRL
ncbi:MAG: hypothetical protein M3Z66_16155 [Chloroflexota bacterium]|nr:hypothetical protein [Chloroflexota bacterium]